MKKGIATSVPCQQCTCENGMFAYSTRSTHVLSMFSSVYIDLIVLELCLDEVSANTVSRLRTAKSTCSLPVLRAQTSLNSTTRGQVSLAAMKV